MIRKKTYEIAIALLCAFFSSFSAGNQVDSLLKQYKQAKDDTNKINILNALCRVYQNTGNYNLAFHYGNAALQLAKELNFPKGITTAYNDIGIIYSNQGDYEKALENYFASLKIREETGDKQGIAHSYNNIGVIYFNQGNYGKALENYFAALKICEETGDKQGITRSYNNIGIMYFNQSNYDKALENYFASLKISEEIDDIQGLAMSYNNIGIIYCNQGKNDKALENIFASLKKKEEIGDKKGTASSYNNIGIIYMKQGIYDKALENYFSALKIQEEIGDKQGIGNSYSNIGNAYTGKLKYAEAKVWFQKELQLANEIGAKKLVMLSYQGLSEIGEKMSDYKNAYKYHQLYSQIKDSIFNETSNKQIVEMQTKYEMEKKEKEIEIQSLKISEQESSLNRNRIYLILYSIGILLLIALGWAAFSRYRIKQQSQLKSEMLRQQELRTNAIIETQEQERKRIAQDLHDGIGHKLTTVKINFEKIAEDIGIISPEKRIIFEQTANVLDETHKEVRTLSHSMMPKALKERELSGAVSDLMDQTLANSKIKYLLKNDSPEGLPENIQICLYRVLQELLNNILKHAHATEIAVQIFKNKDTLIMMVEDDGIGIDGEGLSGIGLHNIAGRVHALKGFFLIEPGPVKGTIATVRIPIKQ